MRLIGVMRSIRPGRPADLASADPADPTSADPASSPGRPETFRQRPVAFLTATDSLPGYSPAALPGYSPAAFPGTKKPTPMT
jgi:hypothetical protein